jgi:hypothetical protein
MSMRKYSIRANDIAEMFVRDLSSEDAAALREDILRLGESGWYSWVADNQEAIFSLVSSSPAKIAKRREWRDPQLRRRFAFAAYHTARLGALTLYLVDELFPGGGYRETCAEAARMRQEDDIAARWQWPFDGEPPFELWDSSL